MCQPSVNHGSFRTGKLLGQGNDGRGGNPRSRSDSGQHEGLEPTPWTRSKPVVFVSMYSLSTRPWLMVACHVAASNHVSEPGLMNRWVMLAPGRLSRAFTVSVRRGSTTTTCPHVAIVPIFSITLLHFARLRFVSAGFVPISRREIGIEQVGDGHNHRVAVEEVLRHELVVIVHRAHVELCACPARR